MISGSVKDHLWGLKTKLLDERAINENLLGEEMSAKDLEFTIDRLVAIKARLKEVNSWLS